MQRAKSHSSQFGSEARTARIGFVLLFALLFSVPSSGFVPPEAIKITNKGSNRQPLFISDSGIVFVSEGRKAHKGPQLYFRDLQEGKEKQITHQVGHLENGFYVDQTGQLFFSSSTDEEKETPFVLKKQLGRFPASVKNDSFFQVDFGPQEIYRSRIDGTEVERLTQHPGYDGFPAYHPAKNQLYFSRWQQGQMVIFAQSLDKNLAPWRLSKTSGHDLGIKVSPDSKQSVWSRFSPDFKSSQILVAGPDLKGPNYVTLETGVNWSPTWHPNGRSVIFSARNLGMRDYDLFEVAINGQCRRQITGYAGDEFFPTVSPDGNTILFTSTMSGGEQIYKVPYPGPLNCTQKPTAN
jgi:Tol biopolymer transport system component